MKKLYFTQIKITNTTKTATINCKTVKGCSYILGKKKVKNTDKLLNLINFQVDFPIENRLFQEERDIY